MKNDVVCIYKGDCNKQFNGKIWQCRLCTFNKNRNEVLKNE